jgi:hypothetical protein
MWRRLACSASFVAASASSPARAFLRLRYSVSPSALLPPWFHASVTVDPDRVGRDAGRIADEVLSPLSTLPGARLNVSLEIEADIPEGAPENVQRMVSENSQVLKFDSHGFEQD